MEFNIKITERKPSQLNDDTWLLICDEMVMSTTGDSPYQAILRFVGDTIDASFGRYNPEGCMVNKARLFYYGTENPT